MRGTSRAVQTPPGQVTLCPQVQRGELTPLSLSGGKVTEAPLRRAQCYLLAGGGWFGAIGPTFFVLFVGGEEEGSGCPASDRKSRLFSAGKELWGRGLVCQPAPFLSLTSIRSVALPTVGPAVSTFQLGKAGCSAVCWSLLLA